MRGEGQPSSQHSRLIVEVILARDMHLSKNEIDRLPAKTVRSYLVILNEIRVMEEKQIKEASKK